jgi:hypothetical protein
VAAYCRYELQLLRGLERIMVDHFAQEEIADANDRIAPAKAVATELLSRTLSHANRRILSRIELQRVVDGGSGGRCLPHSNSDLVKRAHHIPSSIYT